MLCAHPLQVDIYPKSNSPYIGIVITPFMFNFVTPSFGFFSVSHAIRGNECCTDGMCVRVCVVLCQAVALNEKLQLINTDSGKVVISGGLVDKNWFMYNVQSRPTKSMSYQLQQIVSAPILCPFAVPPRRPLCLCVCVADVPTGVIVCGGAILPLKHHRGVWCQHHDGATSTRGRR